MADSQHPMPQGAVGAPPTNGAKATAVAIKPGVGDANDVLAKPGRGGKADAIPYT